MIHRLIAISVRHRGLVLMTVFALAVAGIWSAGQLSIDAIPDLSDTQVILLSHYPGQSPQVVEDQVTHPLSSAMLSVPQSTDVRGFSYFGLSFVYVLFEEGTDIYWARSRVLETLAGQREQLPPEARVELGPDATGVGWVFQYVLRSSTVPLHELRSLQDWLLRYELLAVDGVAEVASVGGFVKQYQVTVDPIRLRGYDITLKQIEQAIRSGNRDVGGRLLEMAETEFMVRGLGAIESLEDIRGLAIGRSSDDTPITIGDVAEVQIGPELRRGVVDLNGDGEVVGGIVVMRAGADVMDTIAGVKQRLEELRPGLPEDVEIVTVYDRSTLIRRAIDLLRKTLTEELIIVILACGVFLLSFRSSLVAVVALPAGVLASFAIMHLLGLGANVMSLGGIAIAMGVMVDASVVMVENAHKRIEQAHEAGEPYDHATLIISAAQEVGPALFGSLIIITVSFLPVFSLQAAEGRLFRPLAATKTFSMAAAALLAITLIPALMALVLRGKFRSERTNPISRIFAAIYRPFLEFALRFPVLVLAVAFLTTAISWVPYSRLGSEFIPPLYEGDFLWMPTTNPGISIGKARELLQQTDRALAEYPEVESVFGKIGRAETATDPAPLSMIETTLRLKPPDEWPREEVSRFYSRWPLPAIVRRGLGKLWPESRPSRTPQDLDRAVQESARFPGLTGATMEGPIKVRLDMLTTGMRAPVGVKIAGPDLAVLESLALQVESALQDLEGTRSVYADRTVGGHYLDIELDRDAIARYGLAIGDVQDVIATGIGGRKIGETIEGVERYPINLRYQSELRDDPTKLGRVLIATPRGEQIPLEQLARIYVADGPPMIKSEGARPNAWVQISIDDGVIDLGTYVERARKRVDETIDLPTGYSLRWSGRYEQLQRANQRLSIVIPATLLLIVGLLYLHFRRWAPVSIVLLTIPFSLVGGVWLLYALDYRLSVAVAVGFIALAGLAVETGILMLVYLDHAYDRRVSDGRMNTVTDLYDAIVEGALLRLRPKLMTVLTTILALVPVMLGSPFESGSQVMQRIAAPMVGGLVSVAVLSLVIQPAIYMLWKRRSLGQVLK
ncbi:MAG: efflux RND transporter permease subunit [Acidobacteriota bacterium]|nr:efflux RND transporter permease subunit [Acidobacteriota bacterium]MDH3785586.1 efflux RND transporter permease subunit [Acidobacteriota bacterium]